MIVDNSGAVSVYRMVQPLPQLRLALSTTKEKEEM
jgi:hypothetical protein